MPITKIERYLHGIVDARAERGADGYFACHHFGTNVAPIRFNSLDDVADFLRSTPRSGVRMNPGWRRIAKNIYIDGVLLR